MHRSSEMMRPKERVEVALQKDDGAELKGYVYAGGQERILDLMNHKDPFLAFEPTEGEFQILNKAAIVRIMPFDQKRMGVESSAAGPTYLGHV